MACHCSAEWRGLNDGPSAQTCREHKYLNGTLEGALIAGWIVMVIPKRPYSTAVSCHLISINTLLANLFLLRSGLPFFKE